MLIKKVNMALRFFIEIIDFLVIVDWGIQTGKGVLIKIGFSICIPIILILIWGHYGAPNAKRKLPPSIHLLLEIIIFGIPIVLLHSLGQTFLALILALIFIVNRTLMFIWKQ